MRRRRGLAAAALALAATVALPSGAGTAATPQPVLGVADLDAVLMGAAPDEAPGAVWAYRRLPLDVPPPIVGGVPLAFGSFPNPDSPTSQLAFLRYTDATGWQVRQTPLDKNGNPYRGPLPNPRSTRITRPGGGVLVGREPSRPADEQVVVLRRDPGGRWRELPTPPPDVLLPSGPDGPAEALAEDRGSGRVAVAAADEGGGTGVFLGPVGRDVEDAVIHWDGTSWTREPVVLPPGSETFFQVLALGATSATNAWMVGRTADTLGRGIVLFERQIQAGNPVWVERDLGSARFQNRSTPADGVDQVTLLGGSADPITVTSDGVWVDVSLKGSDGATREATLFFDPDDGSGRVTGSWCDVPLSGGGSACAHPLGAALSRRTGYRSFAWSGSGFGSRVITNALPPSGDEESNRGAYLSLDGNAFRRMPGAGGNLRRSGAFTSPGDGWLEGPVHITDQTPAQRLRAWPVSLRSPLTAVANEPGKPRGALSSGALAVGGDGGVARYAPGRGWIREFLLTSSGTVSKPALRGVAWPEASRAYAVGDLGAMWLWRSDTGLWEKDAAAPVGFEGNPMDVAFQPGNPDRGYVVGKRGLLLRYGKTWEQEAMPAGVADADLTDIAFAGSQALAVAGSRLLVNDGGGWRIDSQVDGLLAPLSAGAPQLVAVSGLADGGAVLAGRDFVLERDGAGAPWRFADQPLPGATVVNAAAVREGGRVRAVVAIQPRLRYPQPDTLPPPDPNVPPPIVPPFPLAGDGYVLRETADGWRDEQHTAFSGSGPDRPVKSDPILDFDLDADGSGWAVGGWSGEADSAGRGSSSRSAQGKSDRARVQTAGVYRYGEGAPGPPASGDSAVPLSGGVVRFAVAGHAMCEAACADLAEQNLAPDRTLTAALVRVAALRDRQDGPRALLYTGGRTKPGTGQSDSEAARYADLLGGKPGLPVFPAAAAGDSPGAFRSVFGGFASPFGSGGAPAGVTTDGIPGAAAGPGARTHYAFDSDGPAGRVRVVVIDNSAGSLAASDPHQNPAEAQAPWLAAVLADAKAKGIPAIVVGSRDLNARLRPTLNAASDADAEARLMVDNGASAYLFERPEENRTYRVPSGGAQTIPSFGTGTLGYRSPVPDSASLNLPDALFGDSGFLLLEIDAARRDPATNRAPVSTRLIPILDDVSLQAVDGTLLRRSRPGLFQGLGRRPVAGDRWGRVTGDGSPNPPGGDPYTSFPPAPCFIAGCSTRLSPEYAFASSDPDIADFVKVDPNSTNLRKPLLDANGKALTDSSSGLLCAFNAGTTTVSIRAGGLTYSQPVTVLAGSVQRPCGTRPLNPDRFRRTTASARPATPPPPAPAPASSPPPTLLPPPPPPPLAPVPPPANLPLPPVPPAAPLAAVPLVAAATVPLIPGIPPPIPLALRPIPPGGAVARVYQVEEKREEEAAPEQSQAFARYDPNETSLPAVPLFVAIVAAALAGATITRAARGGDRHRRRPVPATVRARQRQARRRK